ncbi:hypothetical protein FN846DRAFT_62475 [Sphaerosporella brunnea]|uniref:Uncharacterized protein n=1 Tax=Sphaerosporella brunnea TaxID=1250544 RepID=A0A5J5ETC7_9PEZI|nr:hypothetical protein FN846DRAFT_62475 [Sphaerosporella brunnea]
MSPNIASGEPVTPQPLQSERTYNTTPGYPAEQLPGSGPSPQVLGSTAEASNREPQQTPRPNGPVHSPDVNEPSHPDTLFAAPGMDELKEVFNLTEEDLQKLQLAGWQLRGDVLDLIRCYHRVEAHCRLISSNNNACAASQKPSAEELMLVIAKMLWNEDCNSLSTAIVNHRAELRLAAETAFSGPVLPNYRSESFFIYRRLFTNKGRFSPKLG